MITLRIQDLHPSLRPREKAQEQGIRSLSDSELLALLIRSGTKKSSALAIAHNILNVCGGMRGFCLLQNHNLEEIEGISTAKSLEILAVIELTKRINKPIKQQMISLESMEDVVEWLNLEIGYQTQESLLALYLSHQNKFLKSRILFTGTLNQSNVFPREIIKEAMISNASRIILVHNHPSGNVLPSTSDLDMTQVMVEALHVCDLELLDHLIVGNGDFMSIRQHYPYIFFD